MNVESYPPDAFDWLEGVAGIEEERQRLGGRMAATGEAVERCARELESMALGWQSDMLETGEAPGEKERRRMIDRLAGKMEKAVSDAVACAEEMHAFEAIHGVGDF